MDRTYPFAISLALVLFLAHMILGDTQFVTDNPLLTVAASVAVATGLVALLDRLIASGDAKSR